MVRAAAADRQADVSESLRLAGLDPGFAPRSAQALSVGEQQRVMRARALGLQPSVLLLERPGAVTVVTLLRGADGRAWLLGAVGLPASTRAVGAAACGVAQAEAAWCCAAGRWAGRAAARQPQPRAAGVAGR